MIFSKLIYYDKQPREIILSPLSSTLLNCQNISLIRYIRFLSFSFVKYWTNKNLAHQRHNLLRLCSSITLKVHSEVLPKLFIKIHIDCIIKTNISKHYSTQIKPAWRSFREAMNSDTLTQNHFLNDWYSLTCIIDFTRIPKYHPTPSILNRLVKSRSIKGVGRFKYGEHDFSKAVVQKYKDKFKKHRNWFQWGFRPLGREMDTRHFS